MADNNLPIVPAVDRALSVLEFIAGSRESVNTKQISNALQLPNTSVFRIVKQLCSRGYLEEDAAHPGHFCLGIQILTLVNGMTYINDLRQVAHSELYSLAQRSRQVVQMGVLRDSSVTYIEQILPPNPVLLYTALYSTLPLNISAPGKVLAAFSSPSEREFLISNAKLERVTANTISSREAFASELENVHRNGYAVDNEEFSLGIGCLAVPIFNHEARCVAAIGLTGGIAAFRGDSRKELLNMLFNSSAAISTKLGMPRTENIGTL